MSKRALVEREVRQRRFEPVVRLEVQPNAEPEMVAELRERFGLATRRRLRDARAARLHDAVRDRRTEIEACASRPGRRCRRSGSRTQRATSSPLSAAATSSSITPTTASTRASSGSSAKPPTTRDRVHQADRLPRRRRHAVRAIADPRRRGGQAGRLRDRAERPLRRGTKPALVARAREGRRPRRLRRHGPQDPQQDRAGRPPGGGGIRSYAHIATGNYHTRTAKLYETSACSPATPRSPTTSSRSSTSSPAARGRRRSRRSSSRPCICARGSSELIEREIAKPRGRPSGADRVQDEPARGSGDVRLLSRASQAGVPIDLVVRGLCCLAPGRPRPDRQPPHPLGRRPLPRALAHLPLRRRLRGPARRRVPDRLRPTGCTATSRTASKPPLRSATRACAPGSGRSSRSCSPTGATPGRCSRTARYVQLFPGEDDPNRKALTRP